MESTQKKINPLFKEKSERQKHKFFEQVFKQCQQMFSIKQFEFFVKCMVSNNPHNNSKANNLRRSQNQHQREQKQLKIEDINPHVLTMPRKINFYQEKNIDKIQPEKKNKRILTTPTEKAKRQIRFDNYEDFQLHKRMRKHQQSLQNKNSHHNIKQKNIRLYTPQPLFYNSKNINTQKSLFVLKRNASSQAKWRRNRLHFRDHLDVTSTNKQNKQNMFSQFIPDNFVQMLKLPQKKISQYRMSRTAYMKSTR